MNKSDSQRRRNQGFTLGEISLVVSIIGLIAATAVPYFRKTRSTTQVVRVAKELRVFEEAFSLYSLENGAYPKDAELDDENHLPPNAGMEGYLRLNKWLETTSLGGNYNWEGPDMHGFAGISIENIQAASNVLRRLDAHIDDGDLASGKLRIAPSGRLTYIIEESAPVMT
jgi:prepilin-type N-terminal cleavage/methylation domain-containing protein